MIPVIQGAEGLIMKVSPSLIIGGVTWMVLPRRAASSAI